MKVKELIGLLSGCDSEAECAVFTPDSVLDITEVFPIEDDPEATAMVCISIIPIHQGELPGLTEEESNSIA